MTRSRVLLYSDCSFFAGCENMIGILLKSEIISKEVDLQFAYRNSSEYRRGLEYRVGKSARHLPVGVIDSSRLFSMVGLNSNSSAIAKTLRTLFGLLVLVTCTVFNTLRLVRVFKQLRIDLLHINNGGYPGAESSYSAVFAGRLSGVSKIIYVVNNQARLYDSWRRFAEFPFDLLVRLLVAKFVTASKSAGSRLAAVLRLPQEKLLTLPNSVREISITGDSRDVRKRIGLAHSDFTVLIVANLERRKGVIYAIRAFERLADVGNSDRIPTLLIEGTGPEEPALRSYVRDHGVSNVRFVEHQDNIMNLMNSVDAILLPSVGYEDFPNIILEAMGLEKLMIASTVAGIPEQITDRETGMLCRPRSVADIEEAVSYAMENPDDVRRIARNARKTYETKYTSTHGAERYLKLYASLLGGRE